MLCERTAGLAVKSEGGDVPVGNLGCRGHTAVYEVLNASFGGGIDDVLADIRLRGTLRII